MFSFLHPSNNTATSRLVIVGRFPRFKPFSVALLPSSLTPVSALTPPGDRLREGRRPRRRAFAAANGGSFISSLEEDSALTEDGDVLRDVGRPPMLTLFTLGRLGRATFRVGDCDLLRANSSLVDAGDLLLPEDRLPLRDAGVSCCLTRVMVLVGVDGDFERLRSDESLRASRCSERVESDSGEATSVAFFFIHTRIE